jgi:SAM-dependent methyltransferase
MSHFMHYNNFHSCTSTKTFRPCPVCSTMQGYFLLDLKFALFDDSPLPSIMKLTCCAHCGMIFYDTTAEESDFIHFYQDHYFIHAYNSPIHDYQANTDCYLDIAEIFKLKGIKPSSRIVDVGCGMGQLIRSLKSFGYKNVAGLELCQEYVQALNQQGEEVYYGSAFDCSIGEEKADVLIYKHIFEHFLTPKPAIKTAIDQLTPKGFLFIAVPDTAFYNSHSGYSPLHYLTFEHINHFDLHHLVMLFGKYGLTLEHSYTRQLDIGEDFPVPILSCLFRKGSCSSPEAQKSNFDLAESMFDWLNKVADLNSHELKELKESKRKTYIWGLSYRTSMYLGMSELSNCNIEAFIDIDPRKQQRTMLSRKISSPEILEGIPDTATVVIGVGPSSRSMMQQLRDQGFKGQVIRLI